LRPRDAARRRHRQDQPGWVPGQRAAARSEVHDLRDLGARLADRVRLAEPQIEVAARDRAGNLGRPQELDLLDAWVVDRGRVVALAGAAHRQVGLLEQLERLRLEAAGWNRQ